MSDKTWNIIWVFFAVTIIVGGLTMAYFGERDQLGIKTPKENMLNDFIELKRTLCLRCRSD